jgi:hypothetical protein
LLSHFGAAPRLRNFFVKAGFEQFFEQTGGVGKKLDKRAGSGRNLRKFAADPAG